MKRKVTLACMLFMLIFVKATVHAQKQQLRLTIAPLNIIDPISGVLQPGVQYRFSDRFAVSAEYGLRFRLFSSAFHDCGRHSYGYYKARLEMKYFYKPDKVRKIANKSPYISVQGFYFPQSYYKLDDYLTRGDKTYHYEISAIKRKVYTLSVIQGFELKKQRVVYDVYFGLGLRSIGIEEQLYVETEMPNSQFARTWFDPVDQYEGTVYRPNVMLGFKLGYILK